jgi:hypothetical protein
MGQPRCPFGREATAPALPDYARPVPVEFIERARARNAGEACSPLAPGFAKPRKGLRGQRHYGTLSRLAIGRRS